jgi:hypothetical protein
MERVEKWKSKEVHPEWLGQILHPECFDQEKSKESLCLNCGYCDEIVHDLGGIDEFGFDDESYSTYKCRKFSFQIDKSNNSKAKDCLSYLNKVEYQEKCLKGEIGTEKQNVQLVLDFSSLKEVMNKGGLVMTTYKCPNCNGMVNIPEAGKVLVCQYCGIPIKPVDIFEKIKLLIQ